MASRCGGWRMAAALEKEEWWARRSDRSPPVLFHELVADRTARHHRRGQQPAPTATDRELAQFDRDYWLAHCEGFRVDADAGRIGFVDEIHPHGADGPVLAVRAGLLGRRVLLVPVSEVAFIVPRAERIWLRSPVSLIASAERPESVNAHDAA